MQDVAWRRGEEIVDLQDNLSEAHGANQVQGADLTACTQALAEAEAGKAARQVSQPDHTMMSPPCACVAASAAQRVLQRQGGLPQHVWLAASWVHGTVGS